MSSAATTADKMICPYCRTEIVESEGAAAFCGGCGTPHHRECYEENGGCTLFGCKCAPPDEPKVQVTNVDVVAAPAAPGWPPPAGYQSYQNPGQSSYPQALPPGFMQGQMNRPAYPTAQPAYPTPMPAPSGAAGTTSQYAAAAPAAATDASATPDTSASSSYVSPGAVLFKAPATSAATSKEPRSRITYILLGLFLGFLGVHNFYAGYAKRGLIQLLLTLLTVFIAVFVTWIWAIVEVCTVDRDNNGVIFA